MYGRDEVILVLVTYSVFLVLEDVIKLVWGVDPYFAPQPYELARAVSIGGHRLCDLRLRPARACAL